MTLNLQPAPKNSSDKQIDFEIHNLEYNLKSSDNVFLNTSTKNHFKIIWIQHGSGYYIINQARYPLNNNHIYCSVPGQQHHLTADDPLKGYIISFSNHFLTRHHNVFQGVGETNLLRQFIQKPQLSVTNESAADLEGVIRLLLKEVNENRLLGSEVVINYIRVILIYLTRNSHPLQAKYPVNSALINNFFLLLEKSFKDKKPVSQFAKELFVSPNHLNHVIKKTTGFTVSQHIQQRIVQEAKRKAQETGSSMKEIAYSLGFDDVAHFSKFFKNSSGVNFTEFKKEASIAYA